MSQGDTRQTWANGVGWASGVMLMDSDTFGTGGPSQGLAGERELNKRTMVPASTSVS